MRGILSATLINLPKSAFSLYENIRDLAKKEADIQGIDPEEVVFTQRDIRERTGNSQMVVKRSIKTLVDYEYIKQVTGINGKRNTYKLHKDEGLDLVDSTIIPEIEDMERIISEKLSTKMSFPQANRGTGADRVTTGA
jgi:DNA-binding MarR family transcriptional regulator